MELTRHPSELLAQSGCLTFGVHIALFCTIVDRAIFPGLALRTVIHRIHLPLGSALGRARLDPRVVCRLLGAPRAEPRADPRVEAEYLEVCLEDTVLGGFSTKVVSVVLVTANESVQCSRGVFEKLTRKSSRRRQRVASRRVPLLHEVSKSIPLPHTFTYPSGSQPSWLGDTSRQSEPVSI